MQSKEESFRITSIPLQLRDVVVLLGVPLKRDSYRINNGKYMVSVKMNPKMLPVKPAIGQHWDIEGQCEVKSMSVGDFDMQEHAFESPEKIKCTLPETQEALVRFIASQTTFKGIGESKARELWKTFGKKLYTLTEEDTKANREVLRAVLTETSISALYEGFDQYANLKSANWMTEHSIPQDIQARLFKHHGKESVNAIKSDPFRLMTFGLPFAETEKLARDKFFVLPVDTRRLIAASEAAIMRTMDGGHTCAYQKDLRYGLSKYLKDDELVKLAEKASFDECRWVYHEASKAYQSTAMCLMEHTVAERFATLSVNNDLFDEVVNNAYVKAVHGLPYPLTQKQEQGIMNALDNSIATITGGAGTGKTTVLRTALKAFKNLGYQIHALALSGRAAKRLHESIGLETSTIAGFLRKGEEQSPDEKHLVVIDEASMVDLPTMFRIVTSIPPETRILLVGDPNQLPPIGVGRILYDVIDSGVIVNTTLDIVKRQEGSTGIPEYSKSINEGEVPTNLTTGNITFHQASSKEKMLEITTKLFALKPDESRVVAPTKALVKESNANIQAEVNPDGTCMLFQLGIEYFNHELKQNDRVIFIRNNYDLGIQNGSLGQLISVTQDGDTLGEVRTDEGHIVPIDRNIIDDVNLGYSMTLHKAQGSQFPRIIIIVPKSRLVDRAWLYTAVTRAENEVHIIGDKEVICEVIEAASHTSTRNTMMANLIESKVVEKLKGCQVDSVNA
ncbi:AAA family ATPase (plasmid) [Photobacterium sp. DA100]|nr:AAA family ATPase [Photobacterium sp. DA100]WEM45888.1 AAA family ATPase [Photobacterium sp. DA100]